jgi:hypothetical protein
VYFVLVVLGCPSVVIYLHQKLHHSTFHASLVSRVWGFCYV